MSGSVISLADLDDDFASALQRKPVASMAGQDIPNGYFTLTFPCGSQRTIRIHTQQLGRLAGKRILSLLIGPENSTDYEPFGELSGALSGFTVWKRWVGKKPEEYARLVVKMMRGEVIEGYELLESKRCLRCNRRLTDAVSIETGVGPECRKKEGMK